ncbi:MAG: M20/M25/M40 family metallo-hydrolase [Deltaproteobacteria bacterium]|nr:M20/M25/M40 family metallo-hydrolase [Deltaproteobacteria bacterium]
MKRLVALALPLLAACQSAGEPAPAAPHAPASAPASQPASRPARLAVAWSRTATLSAQRLRDTVYYLASDELEGRGPATAGLEKAAAYLADQVKKAGLRPAFGDGYRQGFEMMVGVEFGPKNHLSAGKAAFERGKDFSPFTFSASGVAEGAPVFVGYGITSKEQEYDDYAGVDVKGKVAVVLDGEPGDDDPKSPFDGRRRTPHSTVRAKLLLAREGGAVAMLLVKKTVDPSKAGPVAQDAGLMVAAISEGAAKALLGFDVAKARAGIDKTYAPASKDPGRPAAKVEIEVLRQRRTVFNVAGVMGPADAKEAVVLGAHYDHLGFGGANSLSGSEEPLIHNGADDNASGTATVLEAARALAAGAEGLERKVYVVFFAGEEDGLLGSSWFVEHPPVPMDQMAAMVNLDMVGRLRQDRLHLMGVKTASELATLAKEAVEGRGLVGTYGGDGYGPSDHTPFYARGVPVLFLFTGAHADYHKPSDDADTLYYPGMAKVGAVAADLVSALARAEARPTYVAAPPPAAHGGGSGEGRGYGPYFGSIPDFGDDVKGVKFSGVRPGSPAEKAGCKAGDVLVEFNGLEVQNLQDFTVALRRSAPGDTVVVKVVRGGETLALSATLTRRE